MLNKEINGYKIDKFKGRGGFGEVYHAAKNGKDFAIKFIKKDYIFREYEEARLRREISALKKVKSPYTVKYFEDGEYVENFTTYHYIVMEYVEGQTLRSLLREGEAWPEDKAIALITDILKGLDAIHKEKIIHRDLKPENVIIRPDGRVKILDYGLSKIIDYSSITQAGLPIGTFFYMSPEQVRGDKPIRSGSDYYSIGVMLLELLTERILFYPATNAEITYNTIHVKPPYPSEYNPSISNHLENTILKLLEKEVHKRFSSTKEIVDSLHKKPHAKSVKVDKKVKFYPRFIQTDTAVAETFLKSEKIDGANFPINLHSKYGRLLKCFSEAASELDFFADPGTNRLTFSSFRKTKGLVALPYAPSGYDPLDADDFSEPKFLKKFVEKTIELQIANGCSVITAPFFYFENTNDDWFVVNIKLLKESVDYIDQKYPQYKISGAICTNAELLCRKKERIKIIENYSHCKTDFLQFYVDKISENIVDAQLYNFILTAHEIKRFSGTKLVACRVPAIAQGLLTIGFDAITSGLGVLESFDKGVIVKDEGMARMPTRFYFPDLLTTISLTSKTKTYEDIISLESVVKKEAEKTKFQFSCKCPGCSHESLSESYQKPRLHFLYARNNELAELNTVSTSKRKDFFLTRIDKAYALQNLLVGHGVKLSSPNYLLTWKEILKKF